MTSLHCMKNKISHMCALIHGDCFVMSEHKSFSKIGRILEIISCKHHLAMLACVTAQSL